jgi:hypothetical protein
MNIPNSILAAVAAALGVTGCQRTKLLELVGEAGESKLTEQPGRKQQHRKEKKK